MWLASDRSLMQVSRVASPHSRTRTRTPCAVSAPGASNTSPNERPVSIERQNHFSQK